VNSSGAVENLIVLIRGGFIAPQINTNFTKTITAICHRVEMLSRSTGVSPVGESGNYVRRALVRADVINGEMFGWLNVLVVRPSRSAAADPQAQLVC